MNKKVIIITLLLLIVGAYYALVTYIDKQLQRQNYTSSEYNNCNKVWASRGLYNSRREQNTPKAMLRAFSLGANGAEVDIHYDTKQKMFIVSHDHPIRDKDGELVYTKKNGAILSLETFLKQVGKDHYFWLDFKNLGALDKQQTDSAIQHLNKITHFDSLKERFYIEGSNPIILSRYTYAGFKTILGIHPIRESLFSSSFVINAYKIAFYFSNITVIGMAHGKHIDDPVFGKKTQASLKDIPVFLFHVPDNEKLIRELVSIKNVKVVMVGKDLSINRYDINACGLR